MAELPVEKMLVSEIFQKVSNAKTKKQMVITRKSETRDDMNRVRAETKNT